MGQIAVTAEHGDVVGAVEWAWSVYEGEIEHGALARMACERFLHDLEASALGEGQWAFDPDRAQRVMDFCQLLPNIKGPLAGKPIQLLPWQKFCVANMFGFVDRETGFRRFRQASIWVPRGNGKTSLSAPISLYLTFFDGEGGAEGYAAAVSKEQARILFDTARDMVRRTPAMRRFGVEYRRDTVFSVNTASKLTPVSSDSKALDGLNVQVAVLDEIGSHRTSGVYDVMATALSKRNQPMMILISTATSNVQGIGRQMWSYTEKVLRGVVDDPRFFGILFCADEADDPYDEATWKKANPSYGVTVMPEGIAAIARQAKASVAQESAFKTRHLNVWVQAQAQLFSPAHWKSLARPEMTPETARTEMLTMAVDFSAKDDLSSWSAVFGWTDEEGKERYRAFGRHYVPDAQLRNPKNTLYVELAKQGWLTVQPGSEIDFAKIREDMMAFAEEFGPRSIAYDPWNAIEFAQAMLGEGHPMVEFRANTRNFSEPTKELATAITSGRIEHQGDPVLSWTLANVVGYYDARDNVYPRKEDKAAKIDPAIALIMAIGRQQVERYQEGGFDDVGVF